MLIDVYKTYSDLVRSLYPELHSDQGESNRILHPDDVQRASELALKEQVIQLYPPDLQEAGTFGEYLCRLECCAPTYDTAMGMAGTALGELWPNSRSPSLATNPRTEWVGGTGFARIAVLFDLKAKKA